MRTERPPPPFGLVPLSGGTAPYGMHAMWAGHLDAATTAPILYPPLPHAIPTTAPHCTSYRRPPLIARHTDDRREECIFKSQSGLQCAGESECVKCVALSRFTPPFGRRNDRKGRSFGMTGRGGGKQKVEGERTNSHRPCGQGNPLRPSSSSPFQVGQLHSGCTPCGQGFTHFVRNDRKGRWETKSGRLVRNRNMPARRLIVVW